MSLTNLQNPCRTSSGILLAILLSVFLASCGGDIGSTANSPNEDPDEISDGDGDMGEGEPEDGNGNTENGDFGNGDFGISAPTTLSMIEGDDAISISIQAFRNDGHNLPITLSVEGVQPADTLNLTSDFSNTTLEGNASETTLDLQVNVGMAPILAEQRSLRLRATDGEQTEELTLEISLQPINAPDVYLLIGQSNMVGFSGGGKDTNPGGLDEADTRILQLNITANDTQNFGSPENFTDNNSIAAFPRLVTASDPLHESFDPAIQGKSGTNVGLGMRFAKSALGDTSQDIVLVPAAWSGTGFCNNGFEHIAWNANEPTDTQDHLGGTALHDRAIARANLALTETSGILRGILWHQGEADATQSLCANDYTANLTSLVASLRTNIQPDARGASARGHNADIPFILGTMSRGNDERGDFSVFDDVKTVVDTTHQLLPSQLNFVATVMTDDLVPAAFPCGQGSCIHFGAEAYREMGNRYYDSLSTLWATP